MVRFVSSPSVIRSSDALPTSVEEYFGAISSADDRMTIARMISPAGWSDEGSIAKSDMYTIVLKGHLHVQTNGSDILVTKGQGVYVSKGDWLQLGTPFETTEYITVIHEDA